MSPEERGGAAVPDLREEVEPARRETLTGWSARGLALI